MFYNGQRAGRITLVDALNTFNESAKRPLFAIVGYLYKKLAVDETLATKGTVQVVFRRDIPGA
jgi:hypothetical protein